jgi:hypothetical protein
MKKLLVLGCIAFGATAFAASNHFNITLYQDSMVEGKMLKAGDYKVSLENGNAIIKQGKQTIEVPAHETNATTKIESTELLYTDNNNLHEIRVGGSRMSIVFDNNMSTHSGE